MPKGRRPRKEMDAIRESALSLIKTNPTLSMTRVAEHYGVSYSTIDKLFKKSSLAKWF